MRIEMIGHASLMITTENTRILMDPVFWNPVPESLFAVYPFREVDVDHLPPFDILVLSHRHFDHFDVRTLSSLPKHVMVMIPNDPLLERYLRRLGFTAITKLTDFSEIKMGATRMMPARSENPVPEYGLIVADSSGVFYNQVDSVVSPATAGRVLDKFGAVDFVLASWQPMLELNYQWNLGLNFPIDRYSEILYNLGLLTPTALSPGANAFCYLGESAWLNQFVFPVTKERFIFDVVQAVPSLGDRVFAIEPGDAVEIHAHQTKFIPEGTPYVKRVRTTEMVNLDFNPTAGVPPLGDFPEALQRATDDEPDRIFEHDLAALLAAKPNLFRAHRKWNVVAQIEVVQGSTSRHWYVDFSQEEITVRRGRNKHATLFESIANSALIDLLHPQLGWDFITLGGYYRKFSKVCQANEYGALGPRAIKFAGLLQILFPYSQNLSLLLDHLCDGWQSGQKERSAGA